MSDRTDTRTALIVAVCFWVADEYFGTSRRAHKPSRVHYSNIVKCYQITFTCNKIFQHYGQSLLLCLDTTLYYTPGGAVFTSSVYFGVMTLGGFRTKTNILERKFCDRLDRMESACRNVLVNIT